MNIVITLLALGVVIFVHELGHLLAAKGAGIGVYEFAVGFGPKLFSRKFGETLYSLRLFPLGGFVKLAGLDDEEDAPALPGQSFKEKPLANRFITIFAGPLMNVIFGFLLFVCLYSIIGIPEASQVLKSVFPNSPAAAAGVLVGDRIVAINNAPATRVEQDIIRVIRGSIGKPVHLTIQRGGTQKNLTITPRPSDTDETTGVIGIQFDVRTVRHNPIRAMVLGTKKTAISVRQVFEGIGMLIRGKAGVGDMAGPIGIIQLASHQLDRGLLYFIHMMALISISLGVINLFPIPVLDGGHLMFLIYEAIFRRPANPKWETYLTYFGATLLIALMAFIIFNDIIHWQTRGDMLHSLSGM